jgi:hypothetical protein
LKRALIAEESLIASLAEFGASVSRRGASFVVDVSSGAKQVVVEWPLEVCETYFDFFDNGEDFYSDWMEYYESESVEDQLADVHRIVRDYLTHESRVVRDPKILFGASQLEFKRDGGWYNTFSGMKGSET